MRKVWLVGVVWLLLMGSAEGGSRPCTKAQQAIEPDPQCRAFTIRQAPHEWIGPPVKAGIYMAVTTRRGQVLRPPEGPGLHSCAPATFRWGPAWLRVGVCGHRRLRVTYGGAPRVLLLHFNAD